jgi:hypothetical protein
MAASVAAKLRKEADLQVETVRGGLGEFTVYIDDREAITTSRLWYPNPVKVLNKIRALLATD